MCMFFRSLFVLLYFFLLAIVLYVLLRLMDSDYPFGIYKLFIDIYALINTTGSIPRLMDYYHHEGMIFQ